MDKKDHSNHKMIFVIQYSELSETGLSIRWPWGADIIFTLIEIECKQFICSSLYIVNSMARQSSSALNSSVYMGSVK